MLLHLFSVCNRADASVCGGRRSNARTDDGLKRTVYISLVDAQPVCDDRRYDSVLDCAAYFRQKKAGGLRNALAKLYFGRAVLAYLADGQSDVVLAIVQDPATWIYLLVTPLNFVMAFAAFFGEEYGWRYYLQPIMQKRFGLRGGVLLLGVAWGVWHIFLDFFFYTTPDRGLIMTISQIITCVTLGIFFAWAYMKTDNIWVPVILHFLNNNLSVVVANTYSAEILQNQQVTWGMIPASLLLEVMNRILFFFILSLLVK